MPKKWTQDEFINRAREVHQGKYSYDKVIYSNSITKVIISCPIHSDFTQLPINHVRGAGCIRCASEHTRQKQVMTTKEFITKAIRVHKDNYIYDLVDYKNNSSHIIITCLMHGNFAVTPQNHLRGRGCPHCGIKKRAESRTIKIDEFIARATEVHCGKYRYDKSQYKKSHLPIIVTCPKHGDFSQIATVHLKGHGCPACKDSDGEKVISKFLGQFSFRVERQKRFSQCRDNRSLPFDFYFKVGKSRFLIEFDGEFHYRIPSGWGDANALELVRLHDAIKTKFAQDNGFVLIRVPYTEKHIEWFLQSEIEKYLTFPLDQLKNQPPRPQLKIKPINPYQYQQGELFNA